ncbi:MAG: DEAD/DEAH box helicase [Flavobacteriaceae bacterium]
MNDFQAFGLSNRLLKSVESLGYTTPTPIQVQAIPLVLAGEDVLGLAQTGTGKTAAFGLPLIEQLCADRQRPEPKCARSLILAPTRELVNQIVDNLRLFSRHTDLRIATVVGGTSINNQRRNLQRGVDILVATPGRLLNLIEIKALRIDTVTFLVLDEADQMLDIGFIHDLRKIARFVGPARQTLLFSATMPKAIEDLSRAYQKDPVRVQVSAEGQTADNVRQSVHFVAQGDKTALLKRLLAEHPDSLSMVFARTKHGAEKLMKTLVAAGFDARSIHGNKSQGQRDTAIKAFRDGEARVLVATDVAARGIDIPGVSHVFVYDLPHVAESYVHRIGRTARAGAGGEAIAFCSPEERKNLRDIEKLIGTRVPVVGGKADDAETAPASRPARAGRPSGKRPDSSMANKQRRPNRRRRAARKAA